MFGEPFSCGKTVCVCAHLTTPMVMWYLRTLFLGEAKGLLDIKYKSAQSASMYSSAASSEACETKATTPQVVWSESVPRRSKVGSSMRAAEEMAYMRKKTKSQALREGANGV